MSDLKFIISIFGDRHVNMLIPLLYSIEQSSPDASVSVYWEDIEEKTKYTIKNSFSKFDFIETKFNFTGDITKRISSKTLVWEHAASQQIDNIKWLVFIDADTLVIKNPLSLLNKIDADVVITHRNESQFLINTGVIACRNSNKIPLFFTEWQKETMRILKTPELFTQANNKMLPYGGADQMSLQKLINYSKDQDTFTFENLIFKSVHCKFLNETYSSSITKDTHIIHYKGGWRDIIFFGGNFTKNRTKEDSWEMYILYLRTFCESIIQINHRLDKVFTPKDFGLSIPFYLNAQTWEVNHLLYPIYFISSYIRSLPRRFVIFFKERFYKKII